MALRLQYKILFIWPGKMWCVEFLPINSSRRHLAYLLITGCFSYSKIYLIDFYKNESHMYVIILVLHSWQAILFYGRYVDFRYT
jgi:hypothetical protein